VVDAVLADRTEEQASEAAETSRADHEHVGVCGAVEKGAGGEIADSVTTYGGRLLGGERVLDQPAECSFGVGRAVFGVEAFEDVGVLVEEAPRQDGEHLGVSDGAFGDGPSERVTGAGRLIDADDDCAAHNEAPAPAEPLCIIELMRSPLVR